VKLKPESEWRYLGKAMRRIDIVTKCTSTAVFGIDLRMPGMLYATVRTNPRLGGGVKGYGAGRRCEGEGGTQDRADLQRRRGDRRQHLARFQSCEPD
jgi:isoquinoline 1-oxidoreductase beta subunit